MDERKERIEDEMVETARLQAAREQMWAHVKGSSHLYKTAKHTPTGMWVRIVGLRAPGVFVCAVGDYTSDIGCEDLNCYSL